MRIRSMVCGWLCLGLALSGLALAAPAKIPESPVGTAFHTWLAVVRSGDEAAAGKHYDEQFAASFKGSVPKEQYLAILGQVRTMLGSSEFAKFVAPDEQNMAGYVETEAGWLEISLQVEAEKPHRISGLLARPSEPPELAQKEYEGWTTVSDLLTQVREDSGFPAMAAAWVKQGKIVDHAAVGLRKIGSDQPASVDDLFHIGSVSKSITATMIGSLVEDDKLAWDVTLSQALPDIEMRDEYRDVTLEQLLQHRGGIQPELFFDEPEMARLVGLPGSPVEQREAYVQEVLQKPPVATPGTAMHYSNAGFTIAAHIAERAVNTPWDKLVRKKVFGPLKLKSAGFGWPVTETRQDQPSGHLPGDDGLRAQTPGEYELGNFLAPAGDLHLSIDDLARYAAFHVSALRGNDGILEASTVQRLHQGADYAGGWMLAKTQGGETFHWHNGSAGTFYSLVALFPDSDEAIVIAVNAGNAEAAAMKIVKALRERTKEG